MPCSAPCDRLPCERRCTNLLPCGHRCPSFCGEDCPIAHCQECSDKGGERIDLLEFRSYAEVDLDESPIVVLGCGHFFTGETLDGLVGLKEVYTTDGGGNFDGLKDVSGSLSTNVPCCPDCKRPIRQFATKRYNRLINRAVMDEICKRFLIAGRETLSKLEQRLQGAEEHVENTRANHLFDDGAGILPHDGRYKELEELQKIGKGLAKKMGEDYQPMNVLIDAIATSRSKVTGNLLSITRQMEALKLSPPAPDNQIILGAQLIAVKSQEVRFQDATEILREWRDEDPVVIRRWLEEQRLPSMSKFLKTYQQLIQQAKNANLSRIFVAATLAFARVARLLSWLLQENEEGEAKDYESIEKHNNTARELLNNAFAHCHRISNGEEILGRVEAMLRLFEPRYNEVTPEELASIKSAMVSGRDGLATHSGHWYRCINGHHVSITAHAILSFLTCALVCDRRMRHANGSCSMPRVWAAHWRVTPSTAGRSCACRGNGMILTFEAFLFVSRGDRSTQ